MSEHIKKSVFHEVKKELEILENQLKEGSKVLENSYYKKKKIFSALVKKVHSYIQTLEKKSSEKFDHLEKTSRYLLDVIDSNFDFSYTEFDDDAPHDLRKALHDFEKSLEDYYKELGERSKNSKRKFEKEINGAISHFRKEIDQQKRKEVADVDLEFWKSEKLHDIDSLKRKIDQKIYQTTIRTGKFSDEVEEAYETLKSAFEELK